MYCIYTAVAVRATGATAGTCWDSRRGDRKTKPRKSNAQPRNRSRPRRRESLAQRGSRSHHAEGGETLLPERMVIMWKVRLMIMAVRMTKMAFTNTTVIMWQSAIAIIVMITVVMMIIIIATI